MALLGGYYQHILSLIHFKNIKRHLIQMKRDSPTKKHNKNKKSLIVLYIFSPKNIKSDSINLVITVKENSMNYTTGQYDRLKQAR